MAAICLYIAAKYLELHYPVIEDLCTLFGLKSSKEVFIEMEQRLYTVFDWDCEVPTIVDALENLFSQGIVFSKDLLQLKEGSTIKVADADQ